jgi:NhaP-type Na+/H+ and K+/H+ antiporter
MFEFLTQIVTRTPIWVWAILAALIFLGAKALRPRTVKRFTVIIAPIAFLILGLTSSRGTLGFASWGISLVAAAAFTFFIWKPTAGARYVPEGDQLHMPGSAVPMILMLAIFLLNYIINVTLAINPALRSELLWQVGPGVVLGALSGLFAGRALTMYRMNKVSSAITV